MSIIEYHKKTKRARAIRGTCKALDCSQLVAERNGTHGRLPAYCEAHAPRRHDIPNTKQKRKRVDAEPIEYLTITEWKERYGEPGQGGRLDATNRAIGFHQRYELLEPDYCEDAEEA